MSTLVVIRHLQVGEQQFHHGAELPPDLLPREAVDLHLDRKQLAELDATERRSVYRLLHHFSGCLQTESLSSQEHAALALT